MSPQNQAAWIQSKGEALKVGTAEIPIPSNGEIVIEVFPHVFKPLQILRERRQNRAVPLHPGDWKLAKGIIPIPLKYPAILGSKT